MCGLRTGPSAGIRPRSSSEAHRRRAHPKMRSISKRFAPQLSFRGSVRGPRRRDGARGGRTRWQSALPPDDCRSGGRLGRRCAGPSPLPGLVCPGKRRRFIGALFGQQENISGESLRFLPTAHAAGFRAPLMGGGKAIARSPQNRAATPRGRGPRGLRFPPTDRGCVERPAAAIGTAGRAQSADQVADQGGDESEPERAVRPSDSRRG